MQIIKQLIAGLSVALFAILLAAAGTWLLASDATILALISKRLESTSGVRISYQPPARITRTLSPELRVKDLLIADKARRHRLHTSSLDVRISLPQLLLGQLHISRLWLGDTRVEITDNSSADTSKGQAGGFSLPLTPVLRDVRIEKLSLVQEGGETRLPQITIDELAIELDADSDTLALSSRIAVAGSPLDINATLAGIRNSSRTLRLPVSVSAQGETISLSTDGEIDFGQSPAAVEAAVKGRVSDLKDLGTGIDNFEVPGELIVSGHIKGTFDQLTVDSLLANWKGPGQSSAELSGRIADLIDLAGFEFGLTGQLRQPGWLTPLLPGSMGTLESAELALQLSGTWEQLAVRAFSFKAKDAEQLDIALSGQLDLVQGPNAHEPENIDFALTFFAPTTRAARALLFETVPELGAVTASAAIRSAKGEPALENVVVQTKDSKGIEVDLRGRIANFPLDAAKPNTGYELDVAMQASSTSLMAERLDVTLPSMGPLDLKFRVEGETRALQLNQIALSAGSDKTLLVSSTGRVAFGPWDQADPLQSIDLNLRADSADTKSLAHIIGQELPELGTLSARGRLHTVSGSHRLDGLHIHTAAEAPLQISLEGGAEKVRFQPQPAIEGVRLKASATAGDAADVNALFAWKELIPALGPVRADATLSGNDKTLAIESARLWIADSTTPALQANASIGDLVAGRQIKADLILDIDSARLATFRDNPRLRNLNPLQGKVIISDSDGTLGIDSLHIESTHPQLLSLKIDGQFGDFDNPATLSLNSRLTATDMQLLGALLHREWQPVGPVHFDVQMNQASNGMDIKSSLKAGELAADADVIAVLTTSPPQIHGKINVEQFFFPALVRETARDQKQKSEAGPLFASTPIDFSHLKKADLDLAVDIRSFDKERTSFESARFRTVLKSGNLSVSPARLTYPRGEINFDAKLDTTNKPQFHIKAFGKDLSPWLALDMDQSESKTGFDGDMHVDLDLSASGISEHELASSLDGNIYITVTNGRLRKSLLKLVFVDLIGWTVSKTTAEKYTGVSCGVADYTISQGLVSTNAFFMDTDQIMITGDGSIDLGNEQVDYVFLPRKKSSRIVKADPVNVTGSLRTPSVRVIPWKSAASTYGGLLFAPYVFVGVKAAGFLSDVFRDKTRESPCLEYQKEHDLKP